ncbi:MAG: hypothetical protein WBB00_23185 [Mycobacterium sp.]
MSIDPAPVTVMAVPRARARRGSRAVSGERWGYGNDAEGFTAYSGGEWFRLVVDDGRDRFRRSGSCDGGQVGGCVVAAAAGDGGHPAAEDVELGGFVESGEVGDGVDGGHGIDLSPCR